MIRPNDCHMYTFVMEWHREVETVLLDVNR